MQKSLKTQNRLSVWLVVAANALFLYASVQADALRTSGLLEAIKNIGTVVPVGAATVASTVLNGLLESETKARLVFLRWHNALPGHRAFSVYARTDPRIDPAALERRLGAKLPKNPVEQNRVWFKMLKETESNVVVASIHREFLLLRDYAGLSVLFFVFFGAAGFFAFSSHMVALTYLALLLLQYAVVRKSAANAGVRLVTAVLAHVATPDVAAPEKPAPPKERKPKRAARS